MTPCTCHPGNVCASAASCAAARRVEFGANMTTPQPAALPELLIQQAERQENLSCNAAVAHESAQLMRKAAAALQLQAEPMTEDTARLDWIAEQFGDVLLLEMAKDLPRDGVPFREAIDHLRALAALQSQPAAAAVSDEAIDLVGNELARKHAVYLTRESVRDLLARAILALRPQAVPMTDEPQATPIPCAVHVCGKTFEKGAPFCDVIDHVYTSTRRQTPITEDQAWSSDEIMSANALAGLLMSDFMKLIRAIEAHHGITAQAK